MQMEENCGWQLQPFLGDLAPLAPTCTNISEVLLETGPPSALLNKPNLNVASYPLPEKVLISAIVGEKRLKAELFSG